MYNKTPTIADSSPTLHVTAEHLTSRKQWKLLLNQSSPMQLYSCYTLYYMEDLKLTLTLTFGTVVLSLHPIGLGLSFVDYAQDFQADDSFCDEV
ncbi:hypothetical protein SUGI_0351910 [Cryptomeria japonica]|nr:hypothetical protein SUGI_0351910 [Cryptomeria japonica]